ncbi:hypothetical protein CR513_14595, partial [Mucuna pruriens]
MEDSVRRTFFSNSRYCSKLAHVYLGTYTPLTSNDSGESRECKLQEKRGSSSIMRSMGQKTNLGPQNQIDPYRGGCISGNDWVYIKGSKEGNKELGNSKSDSRHMSQRDRGVKHLPYQELLNRKQKGFCYKCGRPYHPLHQCPYRQL